MCLCVLKYWKPISDKDKKLLKEKGEVRRGKLFDAIKQYCILVSNNIVFDTIEGDGYQIEVAPAFDFLCRT